MGKLDGQVAIVTGASRGIGAEIARLFAAQGAAVAVSARTTEAGQSPFGGTIHETVQQIVDAGGVATAIPANLAREEDLRRLVATTVEQLGPVDIVVNNGAVTYFAPVAAFEEKHFRLMFDVQVRAPFALSQLVVPAMVERGRGSILNISSQAALHPSGPPYGSGLGSAVYGMVKAALFDTQHDRFVPGAAVFEIGLGEVRVAVRVRVVDAE